MRYAHFAYRIKDGPLPNARHEHPDYKEEPKWILLRLLQMSS